MIADVVTIIGTQDIVFGEMRPMKNNARLNNDLSEKSL